MGNLIRNFTAGKMNKMVDERLVPNGEYVDALNVRMGSTEASEIGVIENSKGNTQLTTLKYNGQAFSSQARTIGAFEDGAEETIYWFVHDSNFDFDAAGFTGLPNGPLDAVISFNTSAQVLLYHIISVKDSRDGIDTTTLNFNPTYLITGVNKVENLLFFTDDYNPPRKINVTKDYADPTAPTLLDGFTFDDIMVIKKPPASAPSIALINTATQENYLTERFICFAYRYKYSDDEYSATSQWSDPAFSPTAFNFSADSYLNEGVQNLYNTAEITFDTGGPLVTGIDLLFKDSGNSVIKVIEKLIKYKQGYADNQQVTYQFSNSKIFTILPEAEILRLYDNVPRLAQASTLMGNRLMYGNYVEGYNLEDHNGDPVRFDYTTVPLKEEFGLTELAGALAQGSFSIQNNETYAAGKVTFDMGGLDLVEGAQITFRLQFTHTFFSGVAPLPTDENPVQTLNFGFLLTQDYSSVYAFITSLDFTAIVGTGLPGGNIQPMADAANGTTMTDTYNALFLSTIDTSFTKFDSGITAASQAISVLSTPASDIITMQFPAIQYDDSGQRVTEYFTLAIPGLFYSKLGTGKSLHSNRDYEVGIVYMDEFKRATPTLVSQHNTEHFNCGDSDTANSILVNIPTSQIAPSWATNYKFAIKPDEETYETVYSNIFFTNPLDNLTYFLLLGENSQKVTDGQRFIVKADSSGATSSCVYATVLEKKAQEANFIAVPSQGDPAVDLEIPSGVYMAMRPSAFSVIMTDNAIIQSPCVEDTSTTPDTSPQVFFPVNIAGTDSLNPGWTYIDYTIPAGSRIVFNFEYERKGVAISLGCEGRKYTLQKTLTASQDYANFEDWFNGDNIQSVLGQGIPVVGNPGSGCDIETQYVGNVPSFLPTSECTLYFGFVRSTTTNQLRFGSTGTWACGSGPNQKSTAEMCITVYRAESTFVFESEPLDALPDVWYEGSENFGIVTNGTTDQFVFSVTAGTADVAFNWIDISGISQQVIVKPDSSVTVVGQSGSATVSPTTPPTVTTIVVTALTEGSHLGNTQNQISSTSQPAISDTGFFNCYAFGNGVESYKIRDSLLGLDLKLGNRVTSTQAQDYAETRRVADITYSGTYNDESNVNRLNEFNGGLLNFKPLEESFGPVQKMFGRETDVLVLQEDKISYVLQGKNLLSDAGAGNLLTTVPEVLGTQIARIEEYGISNNPESFSQFGPHKFFTDAKRGSLLQLSGTSYSNDQLTPISQYGMRSWFRELFQVSFETQKLGGFDPYMQEYVMASNQELTPVPRVCQSCGPLQVIVVSTARAFKQCYDVGRDIGNVVIKFNVVGTPSQFTVTATYNGVALPPVTGIISGTITVAKSLISVTEIDIEITSTGSSEIELTVPCPLSDTLTLIDTCVTSPNDAAKLIHNQFRFLYGTYNSPLTSSQVKFAASGTNPVVSAYNTLTGQQGATVVPPDGSVVTLTFNKFSLDTAVFDTIVNKFRYLRTATNYPNTPQSISALISASTAMATVTTAGPDVYTGSFTMPSGLDGDYLYLIYDYRTPTLVNLCFGATVDTACCGC